MTRRPLALPLIVCSYERSGGGVGVATSRPGGRSGRAALLQQRQRLEGSEQAGGEPEQRQQLQQLQQREQRQQRQQREEWEQGEPSSSGRGAADARRQGARSPPRGQSASPGGGGGGAESPGRRQRQQQQQQPASSFGEAEDELGAELQALAARRRRMLQNGWYRRGKITVKELYEGILRRSSLQQYARALPPPPPPPPADGAPPPGAPPGGPAATAAQLAAGGGGAAEQQQQAAARPRRPRLQSEVPALLALMGRATTYRDALLAADAMRAVRLALARQGALAPFGPDVCSAFFEMVRRCKAHDILVEAMRQPADSGVRFSAKAVHGVMGAWAGAAHEADLRAERKLARKLRVWEARAAEQQQQQQQQQQEEEEGEEGEEVGEGDAGDGREQQRRRRRQEPGEAAGAAAARRAGERARGRHREARRALTWLEDVHAAMSPAGLRPSKETLYILVRAAHNAGLPEKAAAFEAALRGKLPGGAGPRPATRRLLDAAGGDPNGSSGGGGATGGQLGAQPQAEPYV